MVVNKDMTIAEIINYDQDCVPVFLKYGMHCIGCIMSSGESVEEASFVHGISCDNLIFDLNTFFEEKEEAEAEEA